MRRERALLVEILAPVTDRPEVAADALLASNRDLGWIVTADSRVLAMLCRDRAVVAHLERIRALLALSLRHQVFDRPLIDNIPKVVDYLNFEIGRRADERLVVLFPDAKGKVADELYLDGGADTVVVCTRSILLRALLTGAVGVVLAHNHPSGDHTPSKADIAVTRELARALRAVDVRLHDHLIVGNGTGYTSMRERNLL
ncbi:JAB domain-containing protein [Sphingomonas tagetis]|uniref:JAB domain-containing protein n=1 Tax=Sphingomonas tagetis TaxID=2949092 RepID=UPI0020B8852A